MNKWAMNIWWKCSKNQEQQQFFKVNCKHQYRENCLRLGSCLALLTHPSWTASRLVCPHWCMWSYRCNIWGHCLLESVLHPQQHWGLWKTSSITLLQCKSQYISITVSISLCHLEIVFIGGTALQRFKSSLLTLHEY